MSIVNCLRPRIEVDYTLYSAAADGAKRRTACEHDAVNFRPIVTLRFVHCAFERADFARVLFEGEELDLKIAVLTKERFHLSFGSILCANLRAAYTVFARMLFIFFLLPRSWDRRPRRDQVLPLQTRGVEQSRHVRLPRLGPNRRRCVRDR